MDRLLRSVARTACALVLALPVSTPAWELTIEAPPLLAGAATRLERVDPQRLEEVLRRAGLALPQTVRVVLIPEDDARARATPVWIVGKAFGSSDVEVFPERVSSYPYDSLELVLRHEVVHLALVARAGGRPLPRWFQEGVAVTVSRGWSVGNNLRLLIAARAGPATADLARLFQSEAESETAEAYLLAAALVNDLRRRHGADVPGAIAARVARGEAFARAFALETDETPEEAAAGAWTTYRRLSLWLPVLTSGTTVWTVATALSFAAFFAVRRKRRARRARRWDWDDDSGVDGPD